MILLDSDHLSVLRYAEHPRCRFLAERLDSAEDSPVATTIISFEEQMRGWMAEIHRQRDFHRQVVFYSRLAEMMEFFRRWTVMPFDTSAADRLLHLKKSRIRVGTQDLKIAWIALVHRALLLSANLRDFQKVPGLLVENWLN